MDNDFPISYAQAIWKRKKLLIGLFIGIFLAVGFSLRAYHLGSQSLWIDEGYTINASLAIEEHGYPLLGSGEFYNQGLGLGYLTAGFMGIFGFDQFSPWSARVPSVIFGVLTIIAGFLLARKLFPETAVPWITGVLLTFSTWEIAWSRQARGYVALQFFIILSLYFFQKWLESKSKKYLAYFVLLFLGAYLSHTIAPLFVPAYIVIFILYTILHPENRPTRKQMATAGIIGVILVIGYLWISEIDLIGYNYSKIYLDYLLKELWLFVFLSAIAVIAMIFDKKRFWPIIFLLSVILIPLTIIMEYGQVAQIRYLFPLFPFMIMLSAYPVSLLIQQVGKKIFRSFNGSRLTINLFSVLLSVIIFGSHLTFATKTTYNLEWDSPQPNFKSAYSLIAKIKGQNDLIVSPYAMMTKIYLGGEGLWLPVSLTGRKDDLEILIVDGKDYYTGAEMVANIEQLDEILTKQTGFVVLDGMACNRLIKGCDSIAKYPTVKQIYGSGTGLSGIGIFHFETKKTK
ncbi:MAG TPA: glycosyltransferase family 39 protein [Candidatus Paceibacterota bacterium]|nr:glycosyltransferase family 39 protein [Candidatus Paceibacterota bacterium]HRZ34649.1 glycosyltransferase family 39 protein [Candidatus Paceibacterota bacterium]